jgi:hypothetical protein
MESCRNCEQEIDKFTHTSVKLKLTGTTASTIEVIRLGCPHCNHIQYTLTSDHEVKELQARIKELETEVALLRGKAE